MTRESSRTNDDSPSHSRTASDLSAESFMMKANRANFNSDQRPSQEQLLLRNNSTDSFLTDTVDQGSPEAFTRLTESPATSNVFKPNTISSEAHSRGSMEFDNPPNRGKSVSPLAVIGDAGDMALQEIKENAEIQATKTEDTPRGRVRRKSDAQRTSFVKVGFLNLKEQRQWDKIMQHLNKIFDPAVAVELKTYAKSEEFDFQAILDDIESYPDDPDDSNIIDHLSGKFEWNSKECDKFYRILTRILMDRTLSIQRSSFAPNSVSNGGGRRTSSITQILQFRHEDLRGNQSESESRPDIRRNGDDEKMDTVQFQKKWSTEVVEAVQKYCVEEEYDLEAIVEDLETYEEDNSMIIEELTRTFNWDSQTAAAFVVDLRRLISTHPMQIRRRFGNHHEPDDT